MYPHTSLSKAGVGSIHIVHDYSPCKQQIHKETVFTKRCHRWQRFLTFSIYCWKNIALFNIAFLNKQTKPTKPPKQNQPTPNSWNTKTNSTESGTHQTQCTHTTQLSSAAPKIQGALVSLVQRLPKMWAVVARAMGTVPRIHMGTSTHNNDEWQCVFVRPNTCYQTQIT